MICSGAGDGRGPAGGVRPPAPPAAAQRGRAALHGGPDRPRHGRHAGARRATGHYIYETIT